MNAKATDRRSFLKLVALAGGGIAVGLDLSGCAHTDLSGDLPGELRPNAWLRLYPADRSHPKGRVEFVLDKAEMGQGVMTSHAMIVAEELDVDPSRIEVLFAPAHRDYVNPEFTVQATGGSTSTRASYLPLRQAGAATRELMLNTAARQLSVDAGSLTVEDGVIRHASSGRSVTYGDLTEAAASERLPHTPTLKDPSAFKVIGKSITRLDAKAKTNGSAVYGIDVHPKGALTAVIVRAPFLGGKVKSFDGTHAKAADGVVDVFEISRGVCVAARSYWQARKAARLVQVAWDESERVELTTETFRQKLKELAASEPGAEVTDVGDFDAAKKAGGKVVSAVYEVPFLQHAPMEPMNCTAHVREDRVDIWAPTQSPAIAQDVGVRFSGLPSDRVFVHQTYLGGGFGRRSMQDFVIEAVEASQHTKTPVKVVWSREDDMQHGYLRPATYNVFEGVIDESGKPAGWSHVLASQSVLAGVVVDLLGALPPEWLPYVAKDYLSSKAESVLKEGTFTDATSLEGAAEIPYAIANQRVRFVQHEPGVPVGFWRSVGHSANGFVVESFIDELAHAAGRDPFEFRRELLTEHPRHLAVLEAAAAKADWSSPPPAGVSRGIAQHASFESYCAIVVELRVTDDQRIDVRRVVCAADVGTVVNPDVVAMQLESGVIYGLSATLKQAITHDRGAIQQTNFHDYEQLRMHEAPRIDIVVLPSAEPPTGVGEISVPPLAPAVANAVFSATGRRFRRLPLGPALLPEADRGQLAAVVSELGDVGTTPSVRSAP